METLYQQFIAHSGLELLAVATAVGYVLLAARQHIWCWPFGFASTLIYTWIFWEVSLPFQSFLNAYYAVIAIYGWYNWNRLHSVSADTPTIISWSFKRHGVAIVSLSIVTWLAIMVAKENFSSEYVELDAAVAIFSLYVTYLVTQKVIENWLYWIVVNSSASYLYYLQELYFSSALFLLYVAMSIYGYRKWQKLAGAV